MFKQTIIVLAVMAAGFGFLFHKHFPPDNRIIQEKMLSSVVSVNGSSGIVIYSDKVKTLVLTAHHVIAAANGYAIVSEVGYDRHARMNRVNLHPVMHTYSIPEVDMAIIEIQPGYKMNYSKVSVYEPELGEDIYIAANPNHRYRSLKKGIVSSKVRRVENFQVWEISGGLINGSSGGGAFTSDGKLFGVAVMVQPFRTNNCWDDNEDGNIENDECVWIPLPYMGYVTPPRFVRMLLLTSPYAHHFSYLL